MTSFSYRLIAEDGLARLGEITTARGVIRTPPLMPVGTVATVQALYPEPVAAAAATPPCPALPGEAVTALNGTRPTWLEGNLSFLATLGANCVEHFPTRSAKTAAASSAEAATASESSAESPRSARADASAAAGV